MLVAGNVAQRTLGFVLLFRPPDRKASIEADAIAFLSSSACQSLTGSSVHRIKWCYRIYVQAGKASSHGDAPAGVAATMFTPLRRWALTTRRFPSQSVMLRTPRLAVTIWQRALQLLVTCFLCFIPLFLHRLFVHGSVVQAW